MDDIVYENEVLPELEIEEVLTLEQMLAFQPRFVAFSDQEILAHIHQLLKSTPQRAEIFAQLHRQVVRSSRASASRAQQTVRILPHGISRKDFEDDNFVQEMEEAKRASSYAVQQMGVDRVMFPFDLEQDRDMNRPMIEDDTEIEMQDGYISRILKKDPVQVPIEGARWKVAQTNHHPDYLFDSPIPTLAKANHPMVRWSKGDASELADWILEKVRPGIADALKAITEPVDVHTLHRILAKQGHELSEISTKDFGYLQKLLQQLPEPTEPEAADDAPAIAPSKFKTTFVALSDVLKNEGLRAMMFSNDDQSMRMETAYRNILETVPPLPQQLPLSSPAEIAKDLRTGTSTIETVAEQLIQWYLRWFLDTLARFMERYHKNDINVDKVDAYIRRMQHVGESVMLTSVFDFVRQYSDMAEVKEGNDTSAYDGTPSMIPETVFEENANEEYIRAGTNNTDDDALHLFENTAISNVPSIALHELDELLLDPGQKETLGDAWKKVYTVQVVSGLPIDFARITRWCKQYVTRPSRVQQVMAAVPDIPAAIVNRLLHDDLNVVVERIQDLHDKAWRDALLQCYSGIHNEWIISCQDALHLLFTRWWIDLCHQSVQGTLAFTPLQGMVQHIHLWGSYGPPMEPDAKSGIIHYMMEVAQTVLGVDARDAKEKMTVIANERMKKDVDDLIVAWEKLQSSSKNLNQSERARMLLENTIKALKNKQGGVDVLSGYLPGILYLPQLLPQTKRAPKKAAAWIQGCCAAPLDDTFKADNDWRAQLSALYKIKRFLSKERWSVQPRLALNGFTSSDTSSHTKQSHEIPSCPHPIDAISNKNLQDSMAASELFGVNMDDECWQWIPRSHLEMLKKNSNQIEGWAKVLVEKMYPQEKNKSILVFRVISNITSISSLLSFLNRIGKNIQERLNNTAMADMLSTMKTCLRKIQSGKVSSSMILYACVIALGMPATVDHGSWTMPSDITRQEITALWQKNYAVCVEWNNIGVMMNAGEVQAFITKVREQQKEISLQRLDILSVEDRQTLLDAKNLGLLRIVEFNEISADEDPEMAMDIEGEQEFALASLDADPDMDALL